MVYPLVEDAELDAESKRKDVGGPSRLNDWKDAQEPLESAVAQIIPTSAYLR